MDIDEFTECVNFSHNSQNESNPNKQQMWLRGLELSRRGGGGGGGEEEEKKCRKRRMVDVPSSK